MTKTTYCNHILKYGLTAMSLPGTTNKITSLFSLAMFVCSLSCYAQSDSWVQKSDLGYSTPNVSEPKACNGAVGFSIGNKGYIGTGKTSDYDVSNEFWEYDPANNIWSQKADFGGIARESAAGFSIGSKGYLGTGRANFSTLKDFWEYDPSGNIWTQKADFGGIEREDAVGFSIGVKGYIGTGYTGEELRKDFWEYDPSTDKWTKKGAFGVV